MRRKRRLCGIATARGSASALRVVRLLFLFRARKSQHWLRRASYSFFVLFACIVVVDAKVSDAATAFRSRFCVAQFVGARWGREGEEGSVSCFKRNERARERQNSAGNAAIVKAEEAARDVVEGQDADAPSFRLLTSHKYLPPRPSSLAERSHPRSHTHLAHKLVPSRGDLQELQGSTSMCVLYACSSAALKSSTAELSKDVAYISPGPSNSSPSRLLTASVRPLRWQELSLDLGLTPSSQSASTASLRTTSFGTPSGSLSLFPEALR